MRIRYSNNAKTVLGGLGIFLALVFVWLLAVCASILASAVIVDALYHLGHWLLGW